MDGSEWTNLDSDWPVAASMDTSSTTVAAAS